MTTAAPGSPAGTAQPASRLPQENGCAAPRPPLPAAPAACGPAHMQSRVGADSTTVVRDEAEMLEQAVDIFYSKVTADADLAPFFAHIDMRRQRMKLVNFMVYVLGGAEAYTGKDMYMVHKAMVEKQGLRNRHFDLILQYMRETFDAMRLPPDVIADAVGVIESTRPQFRFPPDDSPAGAAGAGVSENGAASKGASGDKGEGPSKPAPAAAGTAGLEGQLRGLGLEPAGAAGGGKAAAGARAYAVAARAGPGEGDGASRSAAQVQAHPAAGEYAGLSWGTGTDSD